VEALDRGEVARPGRALMRARDAASRRIPSAALPSPATARSRWPPARRHGSTRPAHEAMECVATDRRMRRRGLADGDGGATSPVFVVSRDHPRAASRRWRRSSPRSSVWPWSPRTPSRTP
jgi:hypothetical protein